MIVNDMHNSYAAAMRMDLQSNADCSNTGKVKVTLRLEEKAGHSVRLLKAWILLSLEVDVSGISTHRLGEVKRYMLLREGMDW